MLKGAASRAKRIKVPFEITEADILIPTFCPVFGVRLERSLGKQGPGDNSPTLDRIINDLGYVRGNIVVISNKANRAKSNLSLDELFALTDFYKENRR